MIKKTMPDIFVYIITPIIVSNLIINKKANYVMMVLIFSIFFYSFVIRKKEKRLNVTGITFSLGYICVCLLKQSIESDFMRYVYDTYFLILCSISLIILRFFNKNIIKQIYIDILRANRYTKICIRNSLKNNNLKYEFEKILSVINIHLLSIVFIKVYAISTYGVQKYTTTADLEMLVCISFIVAEIYMISRMVHEYKSEKENFKGNKNKIISIKAIKKDNKEKVIYLNKYKKTNK